MIKNVYGVSQVNQYIKNMFSQDFMLRRIYVKGEVSNCKYHSSGHIYFTIKDENSALAAVMFASHARNLKFRMKEGDSIVAMGSIQVYERDGKYQLYVEAVEGEGEGIWYQRFARTKARLEEMGMFAKEYKKPIPPFVQTLGVVTASTGAAIQDIINISKRRNPSIQIILYPAQVQGEGAAQSISKGIYALQNAEMKPDVIIVGRGGGSIEDLWAFNEEIVARAIFESKIPVISAVGHETDTTIADYVADLRAPTPSAAAELAVYSKADVAEQLNQYTYRMGQCMKLKVQRLKNGLHQLAICLEQHSPKTQLNRVHFELAEMENRLHSVMKNRLTQFRHQLQLNAMQLEELSPLKKLSCGYSYIIDGEGKAVTDVEEIQLKDVLNIYMRNGEIKACVTEKRKVDRI